MKLKEYIEALQKLEKENPNIDVATLVAALHLKSPYDPKVVNFQKSGKRLFLEGVQDESQRGDKVVVI